MIKVTEDIAIVRAEATEEIKNIVPGALFIFVADKYGDLTPIKLTDDTVKVRKVDQSQLPDLPISTFKQEGLKTFASVNYGGGSDDQLWVGMGDYILVDW